MDRAEIIAKNGKLYVLDAWQSAWDKPERYRLAWPTGMPVNNWRNLIGLQARSVGEGLYLIIEDGQYIALEHRGHTKPDADATITESIPKPKKAAAWKNGRWINI